MNNPLETSPVKEPPLDAEEQKATRKLEPKITVTSTTAENVNHPGDGEPIEPEKEKPKTGKRNQNSCATNAKDAEQEDDEDNPNFYDKKRPRRTHQDPKED